MFPTQITHTLRRLARVAVLLVLLLALFVPHAAAQEYDETLDQLGRLQAMATDFLGQDQTGTDPVLLTLSFTRTGEYNTMVWQLVAGMRDPEFEEYIKQNAPDLMALQEVTTVTLPNGEAIDFGHLLAAINLAYKGIPVSGSWGGDCMELARQLSGQAGDVDGYRALMGNYFNSPDVAQSTFSDQDLRADLDAVVLGDRLTAETDLAGLLREYYASVNEHDRAYQFIALSFGTVETGDQAAFREQVYQALTSDAGMQLLLFMNGMWQTEGWQIAPDAAPALRAASDLFADYLSNAVGGERVKSEKSVLMVTEAREALAQALEALGESEAASAALNAAPQTEPTTQSGASSGVEEVFSGAADTLIGINAQTVQLVLLVISVGALLGMVICLALAWLRRP